MSQINDLEQQLSEAKMLTETRRMALRLYQNSDFKKLIVDGFMLTEAARYAQVSGDPDRTELERADALAMAQASGHLKRFLSVCVQMGAHAEHDLPQLEQALEELRAEGAE